MTLVLASASPRRRELLTQAGYTFTVHPAHIPEDPLPNEDPIAYVVRLARQKAETVFCDLTQNHAKSDASLRRQATTSQAANEIDRSSEKCQGTTSVVPERRERSEGALAPVDYLVVLGADTTVVIDNDAVFPAIAGVPASEKRAAAAPQVLAKPADASDAARMLRLLSGRTHRVITGVAVVTAQHTEVAAEVTGVRFLTLSEEEIAAYIATGEPMDKAGAYAIQGRAARWIPRITGDYFNVVGLPLALVSTMLEAANVEAGS